jgi:hypothetical protein
MLAQKGLKGYVYPNWVNKKQNQPKQDYANIRKGKNTFLLYNIVDNIILKDCRT